jgi:hypothetical protein
VTKEEGRIEAGTYHIVEAKTAIIGLFAFVAKK